MHLLKPLELRHILRNSPEPAEGVIAEALDPAFVAAEVGPIEPSIAVGGSAASAHDPSPARGRALVIVVARHWPRHGGRLWGVGRPHEHPQRHEGVQA